MLKKSIENMEKLVVFGFSRRPGAARTPILGSLTRQMECLAPKAIAPRPASREIYDIKNGRKITVWVKIRQ
jgi:hypothetical protein